VPITVPVPGSVLYVTVPSFHALETCETCSEPAVPKVFTNRVSVTCETDEAVIPAGSADRLNLMNARDPGLTCSNGP
jgi:hypothetical protein